VTLAPALVALTETRFEEVFASVDETFLAGRGSGSGDWAEGRSAMRDLSTTLIQITSDHNGEGKRPCMQ